MDPPTQTSIPRTPSSRRAPWRRWAALAVLTACGGTTGLENIVGGDASSMDATSDATSTVADSSVSTDSSAAADSTAGIDAIIADGSEYDRTVPGRPSAQDTGVNPATNDSGGGLAPMDGGLAPDGDGALPTTFEILAALTDGSILARDAADEQLVPPCVGCGCVQCGSDNGCFDPTLQGGTCETILDSGMPPMHYAGALASGDTCASLGLGASASEQNICRQTLNQIFSTKCSSSFQETPCLCGTANPTDCVAGMAQPNGPLYETYACDFGSASGSTINTNFIIQSFGAGMANSLVQCLEGFATSSLTCCSCFGIQPQTCASQNIECGMANDGCGNTLDCGMCQANQRCNAGKCCTPTVTCAQQNFECGPLNDGCGGLLNCGTCEAGQTCSASGQCG